MYNPGPPGFENAWVINPNLTNRIDGDISLLWFTPNTVAAAFPSLDPIFQTETRPFTIPTTNQTLYDAGLSVRVMDCIEQHRFCNPAVGNGTDHCTPYSAYLAYASVPGPLTSLGFNPTQLATAQRIATALLMSLTFNSVNNRRSAALLATGRYRICYRHRLCQ